MLWKGVSLSGCNADFGSIDLHVFWPKGGLPQVFDDLGRLIDVLIESETLRFF